ncbi:hypothetical protein RhiirA5_418689 [Rhizophagus irregularis]|uniref:Uncharacterized protein n=1 Tax=Rhizophagus irregularis TaxID=588596 RepID=A0A2N0PJT0_9GLOM|nr:hypothetical protein RhiirA5_418689 [Rhizophagus irregularis]
MKQPPPPPEPSKKKQRNKWKIWKEKRQEYDDFMSKPYTYRPFSPDAYHQELFGPAHLDPYTSDDTKAVEHRPLKRDTSTNPSAPSTSLTIKRPRPADRIWDMGGIGIWDWDGILANGRGFWQKGWDMGWDGIGDSPIPFNMGG